MVAIEVQLRSCSLARDYRREGVNGHALVPLSPVHRGEGSGEGPSAEDATRNPPLTPALSPAYRGEGEG